MSAASLLSTPLPADERFRIRLEEAIRDAVDAYPASSDPRDFLLHAVIELGRDGNAFARGVRLRALGACLVTIGAEFERTGERLLARAARAEGVV